MKTNLPSFPSVCFGLIVCATLGGCASDRTYRDEKEYSDMPWNTPQQWEGSRQLPGMPSQY